MVRGDFGAAERQLALADDLTPGLPEANQLRADLGRAARAPRRRTSNSDC